MSTADLAVRVYPELENEDFRVLSMIEAGMAQHEFVPTEQIHKFSKVPMDRIVFTLGKLNKLNLTYRSKTSYDGANTELYRLRLPRNPCARQRRHHRQLRPTLRCRQRSRRI